MSELPNFDGKTPKEMRRAWAKFVADHSFDGDLYAKAEYVRLAIDALVLNEGTPAELAARNDLELRLATFSQAWAVW